MTCTLDNPKMCETGIALGVAWPAGWVAYPSMVCLALPPLPRRCHTCFPLQAATALPSHSKCSTSPTGLGDCLRGDRDASHGFPRSGWCLYSSDHHTASRQPRWGSAGCNTRLIQGSFLSFFLYIYIYFFFLLLHIKGTDQTLSLLLIVSNKHRYIYFFYLI